MAAVALLAACGGNPTTEKAAAKEDHSGHDHAAVQAAPAAVQLKDDKLNAV